MFIKAAFLRRLNRFVVECLINGKKSMAYLPNPGRLWELLLPRRTLYLKKEGKALNYTVWATEKNGQIICLHTHFTNNVAEKILKKGLINELRDYTIKAKEIKFGHHRIDFLVGNEFKSFPLEVKSCTLFNDSIAMFPDAVTQRGRSHLEMLSLNKGAVLFIVHSPSVKYFLPDFHTDPKFSETLSRLREKILIKAVSVKWDEEMNFEFVRELEIPWHIYDNEDKDRGSYILYGELVKNISLTVGSLGRLTFKKGYYLYTGSAMNSLKSRLKRHMNKNKTFQWHIDYLVPVLKGLKPIPVRASEPIECKLSNELKNLYYEEIPKFGSSDCECTSHLYYTDKDPFNDERFINILLKYRISRLMNFI
ncbi:DNA/RNA nuclease SfsA [Thermodesulfovibrio yellowstonii]|uniref:GIY-YIG domain-containing protein n=1 Tax=Thermodesulfovibrio yellowstonii TaxID=28262 RepID=A0A9W6LKH1_9BACT|nr:DNA/RNA nuclease SfsA [Thermodesulfovibrio islandicus]GLI53687.1 hypothetical protein TISLANDTSLP1_13800 [Thermodesulfovibrio islandicus]